MWLCVQLVKVNNFKQGADTPSRHDKVPRADQRAGLECLLLLVHIAQHGGVCNAMFLLHSHCATLTDQVSAVKGNARPPCQGDNCGSENQEGAACSSSSCQGSSKPAAAAVGSQHHLFLGVHDHQQLFTVAWAPGSGARG